MQSGICPSILGLPDFLVHQDTCATRYYPLSTSYFIFELHMEEMAHN